MAKFRFQLDAVQRVRKIAEDQALQEMALCQQRFRHAVQAKQDLLQSREKALVQREDLSKKPSNSTDYLLVEGHIKGIEQKVLRSDQMIVRTRRFLEQAMRKFIKARKELSMIERLHEKARENWKKEQSKLEQKRLDDMISSRTNYGKEEEEVA